MTSDCQLAHRSSIRAFRAGRYVLIVARGELPTPGFDVDIDPSMLLIFPPQFNLVQCPKPGHFPQVVTPYRYSESVHFPVDQPTVTVNHADGSDTVTIEEGGPELAGYVRAISGDAEWRAPEGADEAIGFSKNLSFDEAFANAVANLPPIEPPVADALSRVEVLEIGGLFGGIAGFNDLFVRISRTHDG
ncbi:MAG: hypothetical protein ACRDRV_18965 [Pseudonocardiaceae bacterium]